MRILVDDLVSAEKGQRVGISLEGFDHLEDAVQVALVVGGPRLNTVQRLALHGGVDVENDIDSGRVPDGHALVVVEGRVDVVDADCIRLFVQYMFARFTEKTHTHALQHGRVAQTFDGVRQDILARVRIVPRGTARLVVDSDDLEALLRVGIDKLRALHDEGLDGGCGGREEGEEGEDGKGELVLCISATFISRTGRAYSSHNDVL